MSLILPRKRMITAHGKKIVIVKGAQESAEHVLMKAFLWALYLPQYPELTIEMRIGDKYKPDVVMLDAERKPIFWGESGQVSRDKIRSLGRRFRDTHFAIAKWEMSLALHVENVRSALEGLERSAPFDLIRFPADSAERFLTPEGEIRLTHDMIDWVRL